MPSHQHTIESAHVDLGRWDAQSSCSCGATFGVSGMVSRKSAVDLLNAKHREHSSAMSYVIAEDAPIGVQLWPTVSPESAPNFTLMEVRIVRRADRGYVTWIYENGTERYFDLGESVAVQYVTTEKGN